MYSWTLFVLLLCYLAQTITCEDLDCLPDEKCSCKFTDGRGIVDITSLGNKDSTPRFKDTFDKTNSVYYSYNPCGGFNEGQCSDAAACLLSSDQSQQVQIGDSDKPVFKYDGGKVVVGYIHKSTGLISLTQVHLVCDENACDPTFKPLGQSLESYEMTMTSVCACPGMCDKDGAKKCNSSGSSSALSIGVIVIIVAFCIAICYFIGGMAYMKIRHKATGTDLILHKEFFKSFPGLIKAGVVFTFGKCLPKRCVATYDSK